MNINIQKVAAILKEKECQLKKGNAVFSTKIFLTAKGELCNYGSKTYKQNNLDTIPEHLYIRALSSGTIPLEMTYFDYVTSELIDNNSELIDYLIVSNPNINESILKKLLAKKNIPNSILIELAHATRNTKILENLYCTDCLQLQLAILNNPNFALSEKCDLYYKHAFYSFDNYEFFSLKREVMPAKLIEAYETAHKYRITKFDIGQFQEKQSNFQRSDKDEPYLIAYNESAPMRLKYSMLVNDSKRKN